MFLQHKRSISIFLMTMLLVTGLIFPVQGWADDIRGAVAATTNTKLDESGIVPGKVIVKYKNHASKGEDSVQSRSFAASPFAVLSFDEQISVADKIAELQRDPDVDYAEPVYTVRLIASASNEAVTGAIYSGTEEYRQQWGKLATNLSDMGSNSSRQQNEQITVAVMDTGVDMVHPALKDSIVPGYDFINNDPVAQDDNGHGTHVSGIIAANSVNGSVYGIAPGVKIMPLKVLDKNGAGDTEKLINALKFAITNRADIVNMSLGIGGNSRALHEVIKQAYDQKIVLVAAAGNESNHWLPNEAGQLDIPTAVPGRYVSLTNYPAAYEEVVSVGAIAQLLDRSFAVADFSNVGKVDVVAPGVNIYSTALGGGYVYKSGTSQATPIAAGLAVLLKAANKALDTEDIRSILGTSAKPVTLKTLPSGYGNLTTPPNDHVSFSMAYGDGLIQGNRAFVIPRLKLTKVTVNYPANKTVTYDADLLDIHNTVVKATYNVTLEARDYYETHLDRNSDMPYTFGLESRGQLADGNKRLSATFSDNNDSHRIYMYGTWEEPIPAGGFYTHRSNSYTFLNRPTPPVVNLQSGTYTGEQTIKITSSYQDAQLYYMVQTADKTSIDKFDSNSGSLKITQDSILIVATLHKKVYSDDAVFRYKINAPTVTPIVGGGGGGGGGQSFPYKDADGRVIYDLTPPRIDLLVSLNSSSTELMMDARTKEQLNKFTVKFDADIIPKAWSRDKSLVIKSNELTVSVPPNAFQVKNQNNTIQFIAAIDTAPAVPNFTAVSPQYDMTLSEKGEPIAAFDKPVRVTFSYDKTKVKNPQNLGVYVLDEQKNVWNSVGGTLSDSDTITASLPHFSKYAVLEKMPQPEKQQPAPVARTFADIQNHWAKAEIEKLAAARIVDGVDETSFKPDSNMTRAQFVTLLSRALQLQSSGTANTFSDVSADAWYNKAVYAAREANIVSGVSEKEFAPDAFITREQMAVMMVNAYLFATGKKLSDIAITQEVKYSDEGSISDWARQYVRAASGLGLVNGTDSGNFAPADNSTRAQAAVVLHRMLAKLNK